MKTLISASSALILLFPALVNSAVINVNYTATASAGEFAGTVGTGTISYDDSLLTGLGAEALSGIQFSVSLTVFGQTFTNTDDVAYHPGVVDVFPKLYFADGDLMGVDFAVSEHYVADTDPAYSTLVNIIEPGVFDLSTGNLTWVSGNEYAVELFVNADSTAVPVPAAVWLFGSGLIGLVGVAKRNKTA